jgi:hypothetical protein
MVHLGTLLILCIFLPDLSFAADSYKIATVGNSVSGYDIGYDSLVKTYTFSNYMGSSVGTISIINNTPMSFILTKFSSLPPMHQPLLTPGTLGTYGWPFASIFSTYLVFTTVDTIANNVGTNVVMGFVHNSDGFGFRMWTNMTFLTYPPPSNPDYITGNLISGNCCYKMVGTNAYDIRTDVSQYVLGSNLRWIITLSDFTSIPMQC